MLKNKKRRAFSQFEDETIRLFVNKNGENWEEIAKKLPGRTPKQCHDRYSNYLRDGLKSEPWTQEEDSILIALYNEIGSKWVKMMNHLPGRSGNDIKNRWHKHLVKKQKCVLNLQNSIVQFNQNHLNQINNSIGKSAKDEQNMGQNSKNASINSVNNCITVKNIEIKKDVQYLPIPKINFNLFNVIDLTDTFLEEVFDDFREMQQVGTGLEQCYYYF